MFNVSHNRMTYLNPNLFSDLVSMEIFDVSHNVLSFLTDNQFEEMSSLTDLRLQSNIIEKISLNAFIGTNKLCSVDLSYNRLTIDGFIANLVHLRTLNLNYNRYKQIDSSLLKQIENIELVGNYWECDWLIPEIVYKRLPNGMHFVPPTMRNLAYDEIDCYANHGRHHLRHIVVLKTNQTDCDEQRQVMSLTQFDHINV